MLATDILKMVLPVLLAIGLGFLCNKKRLFGSEGLAALKTIVGKITLPAVLFNAFLTAEYNLRVLLVFVVIYLTCGIGLAAGFLLRPLVKPYQTFAPFLFTGYETGMLGYALYGLLVGTAHVSTLAMLDIGQTMFAYTVFLAALQSAEGKKPTAKGLVINLLKNPAADSMLLGILLGALGVGKWVLASPVSGIYTQLASFIAAPTACIILIVIGYEFSLKKELLRPVFVTSGLRLLLCAVLLVPVAAILFTVLPFDKNMMIALLIMFSLPAPFIIPLFADVGKDGEYISTSLSMSTLFTIVLFMAITVYAML